MQSYSYTYKIAAAIRGKKNLKILSFERYIRLTRRHWLDFLARLPRESKSRLKFGEERGEGVTPGDPRADQEFHFSMPRVFFVTTATATFVIYPAVIYPGFLLCGSARGAKTGIILRRRKWNRAAPVTVPPLHVVRNHAISTRLF